MTVSPLIFGLVMLFGSSSWMGTNSVWVELPLLTSVLPEGWNLPSYLAAVVQIACVAPLVYTVLHKGVKSFSVSTPLLIFIFLILACICQLGLGIFWSYSSVFLGTQRSWPLYLLLFGLAIVNAISNVLFMPFMARFHPAYLNAYFVGMGLSSLIPSILSLIQGTSNYECNPNGQPTYFPPNFTVSTFFYVIFGCTCVALIAFLVLYRLGAHKHANQNKKIHEGTPLKNAKSPPATPPSEPEDDVDPIELHETGSTAIDGIVTELEREKTSISESIKNVDYITGVEYTILLLTTALVNAQMNGIIPSVQSYASLPYSQSTYHYGIALANVISPLVSFLPFFINLRSFPILGFLTICSSVFTGFIVYLAALSPNLIFDSESIGSILSIGSSLIAAGLHSYLRVVFASLLREGHQSESRLFWCGVFIQIGSFIGSAVMFPLVNIFKLFHSAPACR
ncbi:unnamed protein product [Caenorhabditis angaria]|uniref:Riboflavin transporter n=1 Tax=Caenorhabditis angaria TaxID=860376 RepID=A0A9P1IXZ7_9PELO|nr:unnamed protein product [Caenorhabditis angaria]